MSRVMCIECHPIQHALSLDREEDRVVSSLSGQPTIHTYLYQPPEGHNLYRVMDPTTTSKRTPEGSSPGADARRAMESELSSPALITPPPRERAAVTPRVSKSKSMISGEEESKQSDMRPENHSGGQHCELSDHTTSVWGGSDTNLLTLTIFASGD